MDGFFNPTVHGRQNESDGAMRTRIEGLLRRIGDLEGENKLLRAKIHGQRNALKSVNEENKRLREVCEVITRCNLKSGMDAILAVSRAKQLIRGIAE